MKSIVNTSNLRSSLMNKHKPEEILQICLIILGLRMYRFDRNLNYKLDVIGVSTIIFYNLLFLIFLTFLLDKYYSIDYSSIKINEIFISDTFNIVFESLYLIYTQYKVFDDKAETVKQIFKILKCDKTLVSLDIKNDQKMITKIINYELVLLPLFYMAFVMLIYLILYVSEDKYQYSYTFEHIFLLVLIIYNRNVQMFNNTLLLYIRNQFQVINNEIAKLNNSFLKLYNKNFLKSKYNSIGLLAANHMHNVIPMKKKLQALISVRSDLMRVCHYMNDLLGKRNLLFIAFNTTMLTVHAYNIVIASMALRLHQTIIYYSFLWIVFRIGFIITLILSCTYTANEINDSAQIVHNVLNSDPDVDIVTDLEHFSLQLLHSKFQFTASDFFPIDFTVLQSIVGTVATYLVILVQFKVANGNTS